VKLTSCISPLYAGTGWETGLEPEKICFTRLHWMLTGLFRLHSVRPVSRCFSLYRRLVITRLSRRLFGAAFFLLRAESC
jgi:hypothetical protein